MTVRNSRRRPNGFSKIVLLTTVILMTSCNRAADPIQSSNQNSDQNSSPGETTELNQPVAVTYTEESLALSRKHMVTEHLEKRDIVNQRVLDVMGSVLRHEFVPEHLKEHAYIDYPLDIDQGQTISQPYIVAIMTQLVDPKPDHKALDIGTGSGYQAAVLSELVENVYSIEIIESLAIEARERLRKLDYENIMVRHGDGYQGWQSEAPFDVIIVAAAPDHIPEPLVEQLAVGGKLVIPVGKGSQQLIVVEKNLDGTVEKRKIAPVRFVPMTGQAED